jgi:hypothetical protein
MPVASRSGSPGSLTQKPEGTTGGRELRGGSLGSPCSPRKNKNQRKKPATRLLYLALS